MALYSFSQSVSLGVSGWVWDCIVCLKKFSKISKTIHYVSHQAQINVENSYFPANA